MNMSWISIVLVVLALAVIGLYLSMTAGRLNHLHSRIDTSRLALSAHLLRRSSVAIELAASTALDPASSMILADTAHAARQAADTDDDARARAESDLTSTLCSALADASDVAEAKQVTGAEDLLSELDAACQRVELSHRFLNDAVRACRLVRRQRLVRWFSLAGRTPWPEQWDFDDSRPRGLSGPNLSTGGGLQQTA